MIHRRIGYLLFLSLLIASCRTAPPQVVEGSLFSLLPEDFPVIRAARGGFSPNGDGLYDVMSLYPEVGRQEELSSWRVDITNSDGKVVRSFSGTAPVPDEIIWDGGNDSLKTADEGLYHAVFHTVFNGGEAEYEAETAPFSLVLEGPEVTLTVGGEAFSPNGDGVDDIYNLGIHIAEPEKVDFWEIFIRDPMGTPFYLEKKLGTPPENWSWDGTDSNGNTVLSGADYPISLTVTDLWGNETTMDWQIHVDVMLIPDGDRYVISLSRIYFQPYTANFTDVPETERMSNQNTLDQVAQILNRYKDYDVALVGHAVHVYWFRPDLMQREQEKILLPLSLARAEAIRNALVQRGIDPKRMTVEGRGGAEPIVPHSDLRNRWMNRRVVFYLSR